MTIHSYLMATVFTVLACVYLPVGQAQAQNQPVGGLEIAKIEGTLEAVAGDRLKVKAEDGEEYFVVLNKQSSFKYAGTAEAKFLRPGFMVRFVAKFDLRQGIAIQPVGDIEIFRPAKQRRMTQEQRQSQTPGVYPVVEKKRGQRGRENAAEGNNSQSNRNNTQQGQSAGMTSQEFKVVGQLTVVQPQKLRVQAGPRGIIVDLAEDTKITVAAGDLAFCLPGDEVTVTGLRNAAQPNRIRAETVEVKGSKTLGTPVIERGGAANAQTGVDPTGNSSEAGSKKQSGKKPSAQ
jgi:hypothetical protein